MVNKLLIAIAMTIMSATALAEDQCLSSDGNITTSVNAQAQSSFLHTIEHHWKFEFWRGAVCWGKPDDHYQDSQDMSAQSNTCSGTINFTTDRSNQNNYNPLSLSWGANLKDDDTFTVNLTDKRVQAVYKEENSECSSGKLGAKTNFASVTYDTRASIPVPQDVWVVQVRASADVSEGSNLTELHPRIGRHNLINDKNPEAYLQPLDRARWTYLYVEPGETLDLAISYANQGLNQEKKFNVRYDFKFIGHNRCLEVLGDPKAVNYNPAYLTKFVNAEVGDEAGFHDYAVKLGCLRNPVFLQAAMNNSSPEAILPALNAINDRTESLIKGGTASDGIRDASPYMVTILDMSLVDISRFALNDLLNYCKTVNNYSPEAVAITDQTKIPGVEAMVLTYSHMDMIYNQLSRQSLDILVNNLEAWRKQGVTYAALFDGNRDAQTALRAYQQAMVQMGLGIYANLTAEINEHVPQIEIAKTAREQLLADLSEAQYVSNYVGLSIRQTFRNFGRRSSAVVDVQGLSENVKRLSEIDKKVHAEMQEYFKYFIATQGKTAGDVFVSTLVHLGTKILVPSAQTLQAISKIENLKSLDERFVKRKDLDALTKRIENCNFKAPGAVK